MKTIPVEQSAICNLQSAIKWFVPDARWLELREALADKIESLEHPK